MEIIMSLCVTRCSHYYSFQLRGNHFGKVIQKKNKKYRTTALKTKYIDILRQFSSFVNEKLKQTNKCNYNIILYLDLHICMRRKQTTTTK